MSKMIRIDGQVWCDGHGDVHEDTMDPYDEGRATCVDNYAPGYANKQTVHRTLYYRTRKGDLVDPVTPKPAELVMETDELEAKRTT
jgi:hypothetical protein